MPCGTKTQLEHNFRCFP